MMKRLLALLLCLTLMLGLLGMGAYADEEGGESTGGETSGESTGGESSGESTGGEGSGEGSGEGTGEGTTEEEAYVSPYPENPGPDGDYEAYEVPQITEVDPSEFETLELLEDGSVSFTQQRVIFQRGTCIDLTQYIRVTPDLSHCYWTSDDTGVLTVDDDGLCTGLSIGSTYVTARVGTAEAHLYVEVTGNSLVQEIAQYPYKAYVNRSYNCITIFKMDETGEYTIPIRAFRCSTGLKTPIYDTTIKNHNAWNGLADDSQGMWSSWIGGNFLFHSVSFYSQTHDSLWVERYNDLGTTCSGGCVRLQVLNAKWIFDNMPVGSPVYLEYVTETPGPLGLPEAIDTYGDTGWDPTDPDEANPWFTGDPEISGVTDQWTPVGGTVPYFNGVTGTDSIGNDISDRVRVRTSVDTSKAGVYWVEYYLTDSSYETSHVYAQVTVGDGGNG